MNKKFLSTGKIANSEKGALLLSVIVMIVIFAGLGAAILSITSTSTFTQAYSNNATKAYYMAEAGFRYATMNIMTISIGGDDCLKCHSSHGKETLRYSAGYGRLPDDTIKVHGKTYNDKDLLDGGSFEVNLAPFWFKFRAGSGDWYEEDSVKKLRVYAVAHSSFDPQCDFPEVFSEATTINGGLYIAEQYVHYSSFDVNTDDKNNKTLIFGGVDPDDISLIENDVFIDVLPACKATGPTVSEGGKLLINVTEIYAFPDTKSVIEIHSTDDANNPVTHLITYENVDADNGQLIGLGDVDESNSIVADLVVKAGDIVTLSKTLKITSTGRYPDADADADAAEKTLEYYRWVGKPMTVPIVYNTAEPKKDPDTNEFLMLAGGNFYWVSDDGEGDDAKGHNVWGVIFATDSSLDTAPGKTDDECYVCHAMIFDYDDEPTGCAGCHREPHPDADSLITTPGDEYCFLTGHSDGKDLGVTGIKDKKDKDGSDGDWQYSKSSSDHNEYRGIAGDDGSGLKSIGGYPHTTTGYCTGCHGKFHSEQKNAGGDWIRHPSDWVIPLETDITKKFYDAFGSGGTDTGTYDPDVPVARANPTSISSEVNLGSDMVMCLSCHVAHGSQYSDMLRWKYDDMIVGTQGVGKEKGCFKCHTDKDDNEAYLTAGGGKRCYNCHTMHDSQDNVCATPSETSMCDGAYPYLLNGVYVSADCPHPKP